MNKQIETEFTKQQEPQKAAERLVELVLDLQETDSITSIVLTLQAKKKRLSKMYIVYLLIITTFLLSCLSPSRYSVSPLPIPTNSDIQMEPAGLGQDLDNVSPIPLPTNSDIQMELDPVVIMDSAIYSGFLSTSQLRGTSIDSNTAKVIVTVQPPELIQGQHQLAEASEWLPVISQNQQVPLVDGIRTLPHDGLFIRRNNQFGTRLDYGIKDLIENGVLVNQTEIRFDDFVALSGAKVPIAEEGKAIAVSYGLSPIPDDLLEDSGASHYLEIAVKASNNIQDAPLRNQPLSANYVFVVDVSGSMEGPKLDIAKSSIEKLFNQLNDEDVIGIIQFDDAARTVLGATRVASIDESEFSSIVSRIVADGGTDLNTGLLFGITELSHYANPESENSVFLFSDGNPTSGEENWIRIRNSVESELRNTARINTFAFGSDANLRELDALSGMTGGDMAFIEQTSDIQFALQDKLERRPFLAAMNIQLKIDINREISIHHFYGHDLVTEPAARAAVMRDVELARQKTQAELGIESQDDIVTQKDGIRIFVPDLAIGETYWIVLELKIPDSQNVSMGKATVQYVDTFAKENISHNIDLNQVGELEPSTVLEHALGLWTSEVLFYALDDLYSQDLSTARLRIEEHIKILESVDTGLISEGMRDDAITLKKFFLLANNLGKQRHVRDDSSIQAASYLTYGLNQFGQVRNGFLRKQFAPLGLDPDN